MIRLFIFVALWLENWFWFTRNRELTRLLWDALLSLFNFFFLFIKDFNRLYYSFNKVILPLHLLKWLRLDRIFSNFTVTINISRIVILLDTQPLWSNNVPCYGSLLLWQLKRCFRTTFSFVILFIFLFSRGCLLERFHLYLCLFFIQVNLQGFTFLVRRLRSCNQWLFVNWLKSWFRGWLNILQLLIISWRWGL